MGIVILNSKLTFQNPAKPCHGHKLSQHNSINVCNWLLGYEITQLNWDSPFLGKHMLEVT